MDSDLFFFNFSNLYPVTPNSVEVQKKTKKTLLVSISITCAGGGTQIIFLSKSSSTTM